jgi:hypothetical protein
LDFDSLLAVDFWAYDISNKKDIKYIAFDIRPLLLLVLLVMTTNKTKNAAGYADVELKYKISGAISFTS